MGIEYGPTTSVLAVDPRTGNPADEYVRSIREQQAIWQFLPDVINSYELNHCQPNLVALSDDVSKFGANYIARPLKSGQPYHWGPSPTYIWAGRWQFLSNLRNYCHKPIATTPVAELEFNAPASNMAGDSDPDVNAGLLNPKHHYLPLTPEQCAALKQAEASHMSNAPSRVADQLAFEATARDLEEEQLFTLIWDPTVNPENPPNVVAGLEHYMMQAHMMRTAAFHCDTGEPPDMFKVVTFGLEHAEGHFCLAVHQPDLLMKTVCTDKPVDYCPKVTCAKLATMSPS